jgi:protoporphyrinogen oxidase
MANTLIIGGGITGLTAAYYLHKAGRSFSLVEAQNTLGGRVQTDVVDGYRLDRGFQVFLTAYPEAKRILDYAALDLRTFKPGSVILSGGKARQIGDPLRDPASLLPTLSSGIGNMSDKLKILKLKQRLSKTSVESIFAQTEKGTSSVLREDYGFSDDMIARFFMPFYRGIFLENDLSTSRRMFDFVFKMFSQGDAAIPAQGIGAIADQLANHLPTQDITLGTSVTALDSSTAKCSDGSTLDYDQCILAVDQLHAAQLLGQKVPADYRSTTTVYYSCDTSDLAPRLITLLPDGMVNNICDLTSLSSHYAPAGKRLISLTLRDVDQDTDIDLAIKAALADILPESQSWQHIKTYDIKYALPDQTHVEEGELTVQGNTYICGDYLHYGSLNAAMRSGRLAAEAIINK